MMGIDRPVGRDRRTRGREYLFVRVRLTCPKNHHLGWAWQDLDGDARNHVSGEWSWVDTPHGGRIEARCPKCAADCRLRWQRVVDELAELSRTRRHTGRLAAS